MPREIAHADEAKFITGVVLPVDGGKARGLGGSMTPPLRQNAVV